MSRLFDPLKVGALTLPNRVIMAPLTRKRAGVERVPNAMMAEYYRQRAGAGLILRRHRRRLAQDQPSTCPLG